MAAVAEHPEAVQAAGETVAMTATAVSSIFVVANSLRLRRFRSTGQGATQ